MAEIVLWEGMTVRTVAEIISKALAGRDIELVELPPDSLSESRVVYSVRTRTYLDEMTDEQLRELFGEYCECRPLDVTRAPSDHASQHHCDTSALAAIQAMLMQREVPSEAR